MPPPRRYDLNFGFQAIASPACFAAAASGGRWRLARHLAAIDRALLDTLRGRSPPVLVIEAPPRHGKSELVSKYLPAWFLGAFPDKRVMLAGYGAGFARDWGRKARELLREFGPEFFGVRVQRDRRAADDWGLEGRTGGMVVAGVGGPLTGRGADLLIIDDATLSQPRTFPGPIRMQFPLASRKYLPSRRNVGSPGTELEFAL